MKHLEAAFVTLANPYISLDGNVISFTIQDGPIGEAGENGTQVTDMLEFVLEVYRSLNRDFPCHQNSNTIRKIKEALMWQEDRTRDRVDRGVEGLSKE